ncbi:MAG: hypothetical protein ACHQ01_06590 [Candidatus Limnocylindrales bacterium]
MPVGRWACELVRRRYASARGAGRTAIVAVAILGALSNACSLSTSGNPNQSTPPSGTVAAASANQGSPSPEITAPSAPASAASQGSSPSATPADGDDETGATSAPGFSFTPGPTGIAIARPGPVSAADRLPGEPDPALTPGALNPSVTQATIRSTICVSGWTATIRPPSDYTTGLKIEQIRQYGYSDNSTADYEEDHLISLELGGSPTDPRNLWPEPYTASLADGRPTGAHVKDGFETRLKSEVCAGSITLALAQSEIGDHWVHAYYGIAISVGGPTAGLIAGPTATPGATAGPVGSLSVSITSLPASVGHGTNATMVALTSPGATCSASVTYASGTVSTAAGLQPHPVADASGSVSWTWKVGTTTKPGASTATVSCSLGGSTASVSQTFQVT